MNGSSAHSFDPAFVKALFETEVAKLHNSIGTFANICMLSLQLLSAVYTDTILR